MVQNLCICMNSFDYKTVSSRLPSACAPRRVTCRLPSFSTIHLPQHTIRFNPPHSATHQFQTARMRRCCAVLMQLAPSFSPRILAPPVQKSNCLPSSIFTAKAQHAAALSGFVARFNVSRITFTRLFSDARSEGRGGSDDISHEPRRESPPPQNQVHWRENLAAMRREKSRSNSSGYGRGAERDRDADRPGRRERYGGAPRRACASAAALHS